MVINDSVTKYTVIVSLCKHRYISTHIVGTKYFRGVDHELHRLFQVEIYSAVYFKHTTFKIKYLPLVDEKGVVGRILEHKILREETLRPYTMTVI